MLNDAADTWHKAHIQHAVAFVKDEELDLGQVNGPVTDEVEQSSGAGDDDVHSGTNLLYLSEFADTAIHGYGTKTGLVANGLEFFQGLFGQFSGWREDQAPDLAPAALDESFQDGQGKGRSLPGPGLGQAYDVTALKGRGNGLVLDGSRSGVSTGSYPGLDLGMKFKSRKIHFLSFA
jgi:hypothetical protein